MLTVGRFGKITGSFAEAVSDISDNPTVMIGGFGSSGTPVELIDALIDRNPRNVAIVANNASTCQVVPAGGIDPKYVVTPALFVNRIVKVPNPQLEGALVRAGTAYP